MPETSCARPCSSTSSARSSTGAGGSRGKRGDPLASRRVARLGRLRRRLARAIPADARSRALRQAPLRKARRASSRERAAGPRAPRRDERERGHARRADERVVAPVRRGPTFPSASTRLRERFLIAPVSNGNISLMAGLARHNHFHWDAILGAELADDYKPNPEVYLTAAAALDLAAARLRHGRRPHLRPQGRRGSRPAHRPRGPAGRIRHRQGRGRTRHEGRLGGARSGRPGRHALRLSTTSAGRRARDLVKSRPRGMLRTMSSPPSNRKPGTKTEAPQEPFKRAVAGCMRAIARHAGAGGHLRRRAAGPRRRRRRRQGAPARAAAQADAARKRPSCADMRIRWPCDSPATTPACIAGSRPQDQAARAVFDAVEQARVEAIGSRRMAGVAGNLVRDAGGPLSPRHLRRGQRPRRRAARGRRRHDGARAPDRARAAQGRAAHRRSLAPDRSRSAPATNSTSSATRSRTSAPSAAASTSCSSPST